MMQDRVSKKTHCMSKTVSIGDTKVHYLELGTGRPIIFLPTLAMSAESLKSIFERISHLGRCLALDWVGMGGSTHSGTVFGWQDQAKLFADWVDALKLHRAIIVMQGYGSIMGLHYAMQHESNCTGLVFLEAFLEPLLAHDISLSYQDLFLGAQSLLAHESDANKRKQVILDYISQLSLTPIDNLLASHGLSYLNHPENVATITKAFLELPNGEGTPLDELLVKTSNWLMQTQLPKLLLYTIPGCITTISSVLSLKTKLQRLEVFELGEELHLAQNTYAEMLGEIISAWLQGVEQSGG